MSNVRPQHLFSFYFCVILFLYSCGSSTGEKKYSPEVELKAARMTDSIINNIHNNINFDTIEETPCPIKITSSKLTKSEYSSYKDIHISYSNKGQKDIEGIKFKWYGETVFNEPADMGSFSNLGFGGGFTEDVLKAGESDYATFEIHSRNAKKIIKVWVNEIVFSDGTKWESKSK